MTLIAQLKQDVDAFFQSRAELGLFWNERDLQTQLCIFLNRSKHYDHILTEYHVPRAAIVDDLKLEEDEYLWNDVLQLDIVVQKGDDYAVIELKHKTQSVQAGVKVNCFGETINHAISLAGHGAYNDNTYKFWCDVKRIELVKRRFDKVVGGLAIFVTNDKAYKNGRTGASAGYNMEHGKAHPRCRPTNDSYKGITTDADYQTNWQDIAITTNPASPDALYYCVVEVA
ncbi:hypothetical protein B0181_02685 [Moraxella caviae]|uniref:Uncharacterized protein n=1 Tax=Moraxella caviae TaxID=34060 RepID=A0A1T0A7K5_9GAMM|nr:hypothetical protein [Moraxella caviae]OOR91670.1 hypothetical protein B0181_02685 [Moraxella caviae]STZ10412.1 Uncharacterised protein [Moraxella caviae]